MVHALLTVKCSHIPRIKLFHSKYLPQLATTCFLIVRTAPPSSRHNSRELEVLQALFTALVAQVQGPQKLTYRTWHKTTSSWLGYPQQRRSMTQSCVSSDSRRITALFFCGCAPTSITCCSSTLHLPLPWSRSLFLPQHPQLFVLSVAIGEDFFVNFFGDCPAFSRPAVSLRVRILGSTCRTAKSTFNSKLFPSSFHFGMLPFFILPKMCFLPNRSKSSLDSPERSAFGIQPELLFAESSSFPSLWPAILAPRSFAQSLGGVPGTFCSCTTSIRSCSYQRSALATMISCPP